MEAEIVRMCCNLFNVSIYSAMYMHVFCANVLFILNTYLRPSQENTEQYRAEPHGVFTLILTSKTDLLVI